MCYPIVWERLSAKTDDVDAMTEHVLLAPDSTTDAQIPASQTELAHFLDKAAEIEDSRKFKQHLLVSGGDAQPQDSHYNPATKLDFLSPTNKPNYERSAQIVESEPFQQDNRHIQTISNAVSDRTALQSLITAINGQKNVQVLPNLQCGGTRARRDIARDGLVIPFDEFEIPNSLNEDDADPQISNEELGNMLAVEGLDNDAARNSSAVEILLQQDVPMQDVEDHNEIDHATGIVNTKDSQRWSIPAPADTVRIKKEPTPSLFVPDNHVEHRGNMRRGTSFSSDVSVKREPQTSPRATNITDHFSVSKATKQGRNKSTPTIIDRIESDEDDLTYMGQELRVGGNPAQPSRIDTSDDDDDFLSSVRRSQARNRHSFQRRITSAPTNNEDVLMVSDMSPHTLLSTNNGQSRPPLEALRKTNSRGENLAQKTKHRKKVKGNDGQPRNTSHELSDDDAINDFYEEDSDGSNSSHRITPKSKPQEKKRKRDTDNRVEREVRIRSTFKTAKQWHANNNEKHRHNHGQDLSYMQRKKKEIAKVMSGKTSKKNRKNANFDLAILLQSTINNDPVAHDYDDFDIPDVPSSKPMTKEDFRKQFFDATRDKNDFHKKGITAEGLLKMSTHFGRGRMQRHEDGWQLKGMETGSYTLY